MYFLPTRIGLGLLPSIDITTAHQSLVQPALTRDVAPLTPLTPGRPVTAALPTAASRLSPGRTVRDLPSTPRATVPSGTRINQSAPSTPAPTRQAPTPEYLPAEVVPSVPPGAIYADPKVRLRQVAEFVLDDVRRNGCGYDRKRVAELMRRYATAQGAPLASVVHSGAYGVDVQLTLNDILGSAVAPSTCGSVADPLPRAPTSVDRTPESLHIGPNGAIPSKTSMLLVAGVVGVALLGSLFLLLVFMKKKDKT